MATATTEARTPEYPALTKPQRAILETLASGDTIASGIADALGRHAYFPGGFGFRYANRGTVGGKLRQDTLRMLAELGFVAAKSNRKGTRITITPAGRRLVKSFGG